VYRLRDNTTVEDPRLDRIKQFDERSRQFPVRTLLAPDKQPRSYTWSVDNWLDQHTNGGCVGYGISHDLSAKPQPVPNVNGRFATALYYAAQHHDPWEGGEYPGANPRYSGTSVLAGMQMAKALGHYGEYRWAFGEPDLRLAVAWKGPVIIGVNWYEGMRDPNVKGFLEPTGGLLGGHCCLVFSVGLNSQSYRIWNSWGKDWGIGGTARISFTAMDQLLHEEGEAAIPTVRSLTGSLQPEAALGTAVPAPDPGTPGVPPGTPAAGP
jgi:hypothetical protein